jgi:transcriptional regulator with XRE-family HTH domain
MVTLGDRIESRLRELRISQSELARRAELPQTTVNSLIRAGRRSTPHLLRIARELGTTPAYLNGETDDPQADAPPAPELTFDERELLDCFRVLTPADRSALLHIARAMAGRSSGGEPKTYDGGSGATLHTPKMEYHGK